jgi:hypothetical protein
VHVFSLFGMDWDSFFTRLIDRSENHILFMTAKRSGKEVML